MPPAAVTRASAWCQRLYLIAGLAIVGLLPAYIVGDGRARFEALQSLMDGKGPTGAAYPVWGVLGAAPLYLLGQATGRTEQVTGRYNGLLALACVAGLWLTLRRHLEARLLRDFLLLVLGSSMFAAHALHFYGEMFTATTCGVGLALASVASTARRREFGWALAVLGVANTPAALPALAVVCVERLLRSRRLRALWPVPVAVGLVVADNHWRHVDLLFGSYAGQRGARTVLPYSHLPGFSYPFALGLAVIVFSAGKGLAFFTPGLAVGLARPVRGQHGPAGALLGTWLLFVGGLVVVYARWWAWYGGVFWGPRFFLVASLPASLALAVVAQRRERWWAAASVVLIGLSTWVAVDGASLQTLQAFRICTANGYALEHLCWYAPEFSPLWRPFLDHPHPSSAQLAYAIWATGAAALVLRAPVMTLLHRGRSDSPGKPGPPPANPAPTQDRAPDGAHAQP